MAGHHLLWGRYSVWVVVKCTSGVQKKDTQGLSSHVGYMQGVGQVGGKLSALQGYKGYEMGVQGLAIVSDRGHKQGVGQGQTSVFKKGMVEAGHRLLMQGGHRKSTPPRVRPGSEEQLKL